jgi:5-methylcytosine-specific restriction protein A
MYPTSEGSRCIQHRRAADKARRPEGNPYSTAGHRRFRAAVLRRDPVCVLCGLALATVADHWPLSRKQLEERGMDPNDPAHGRGVCKPDHDRETARNQPGGFRLDQ